MVTKMRLPKLLNADFEQSLNLLDDSAVDYFKEQWDERPKWGRIAKTIGYLVMLVTIWLCFSVSMYVYNNPGEYTAQINFFPPWLFWVILTMLIFLFVWIYGKGKNWKCMEFYNTQILSFWYCLLLLLVGNLFVATVLTPVITIYGITGGYAAVVTAIIRIWRNEVRMIIGKLYDIKMEQGHKNKFLGKALNFTVLAKVGTVVLGVYYIYKFLFVSSESVITVPLFIGGLLCLTLL